MDSQNNMVLQYMRRHKGGINPKDAEQHLGVMRLSGRIHDLRRAGHRIDTVMRKEKNRFGKTVQFAQYVLAETDEG